jgi:hypothetical protein
MLTDRGCLHALDLLCVETLAFVTVDAECGIASRWGEQQAISPEISAAAGPNGHGNRPG